MRGAERSAKSQRVAHGALLGTLLLAGAAAALGCPGEADGNTHGNATGATCDTAISYENDIAPLMLKYCTSCHAAELAPEDRHGAPTDHNFDSEAGLLDSPEHVIDYAGAGAMGTNSAMPPAGWPTLSYGERQMLANYLICYADGSAPDHSHDAGH